jgi:hypothetical protein
MRNCKSELREVTKFENVVISNTVTCNKCGNTIEPNTSENMSSISLGFGYWSKFDMEHWSFDICDNCLEDVIKTFKIAPDGFKVDSGWLVSEKEHQKVFEKWKDTGIWDDRHLYEYGDEEEDRE